MIAASLARLAAGVVSPGGRRGRLGILIYHRVLAQHDPLMPDEPDASDFRWQLQTLASAFQVLPLGEAVQRLRDGTLPARAACITFDDGYANNRTVALPVLQALGMSATFFVATGYLDGGRMFNDSVIELVRRTTHGVIDTGTLELGVLPLDSVEQKCAAIRRILPALKYLEPEQRVDYVERQAQRYGVTLPHDLMMSSVQVRELADAGMEVGAHTVHHPILTSVGVDRARDEMMRSRQRLEAICERPVRLFAYPNGQPHRDYRAEHVAVLRELEFDAAVSTAWGVAHAGSDPYQLPRLLPWDRTALRFNGRLLRSHLRRECAAV